MFQHELKIGTKGKASTIVTTQNTAAAVGSGSLEVFATPMMIALMERAAVDCLSNCLADDHTSVGTAIAVSHLRASAVGETLTAVAELSMIDRRKLAFALVVLRADGAEVGTEHTLDS